jgi:hypothetical protein
MEQVKNNSFSNGAYVWFVGMVVDVNDPDMDGRVKVRIMGYHPDAEGQINVNDLPWAMVETGVMSASTKGIGFAPHGLLKDSFVKGHFLDGSDAQLPMVTGTFYGEGDMPELARGKNTVKKTLVSAGGIQEPKSPYASKYPHNKVMVSPTGHVIEIDDTPNAERLHIFHKSGTFIEFHPDGKAVYHNKNASYFITEGSHSQVTNGDFKHFVSGNYDLQVGGSYSAKISGSGNIQTGGTLNIKAGGSANIQSGGSMALKAGGTMSHKAAVINQN